MNLNQNIVQKEGRLSMLVEDWQGAEVYEDEPEVYVYWPYGGRA